MSTRRKATRLSISSHKEQDIHSLNPHDVVLGRGQHVKHTGNARFLRLVRSRAAKYHACTSKTSKDAIARQIVRVVEDLEGRFVKRSEAHSRTAAPVWVIADQAAVMIKVKQTFRDYSVVRRKAAASASLLDSTLPISQITAASAIADPGRNPGEIPLQSPPVVDPSEVTAAPSTTLLGTQNNTPLHNHLLVRLGLAESSLSTLASQVPLQQQLPNRSDATVHSGSAAQSAPSFSHSDTSHSRLNEIIQSLAQQELVRQFQLYLDPQAFDNNSHNLIAGLPWLLQSNSEMHQSLYMSQPHMQQSQLGGIYTVPQAPLPFSSSAPLPLSHLQLAAALNGWNSMQGSLTPADALLATTQRITSQSVASQPQIP
jgi:hypothetical protein